MNQCCEKREIYLVKCLLRLTRYGLHPDPCLSPAGKRISTYTTTHMMYAWVHKDMICAKSSTCIHVLRQQHACIYLETNTSIQKLTQRTRSTSLAAHELHMLFCTYYSWFVAVWMHAHVTQQFGVCMHGLDTDSWFHMCLHEIWTLFEMEVAPEPT